MASFDTPLCWQTPPEALPPDGTWCWVWHTAWGRSATEPPDLVTYDATSQDWWTPDGRLRMDAITHWVRATWPVPPPHAGTC